MSVKSREREHKARPNSIPLERNAKPFALASKEWLVKEAQKEGEIKYASNGRPHDPTKRIGS